MELIILFIIGAVIWGVITDSSSSSSSEPDWVKEIKKSDAYKNARPIAGHFGFNEFEKDL